MFKNYIEFRNWLENFIPLVYGKEELGLARIENLLKKLGNPQDKFKSIHVGGTSGKGSTCFYISRLLIEKGFSVGLHISPHLIYVGERMQINGENIPVGRLLELANEIGPVVDDIKSKQPHLAPSYFEILVAMSFLYFAFEKVDFAVVEVGLGGRLDATNVLRPKITVITNVGLDHTEILGDTVEKIAKEKAGIIKNDVPILTGASGKALKVIENVAKKRNAQLIKINTQNNLIMGKTDAFGYVSEPYYTFRHAGSSFVSKNQNLALLTVLGLGIKLDGRTVKKAFDRGYIGRFEHISDMVVVDGAHNTDKVRALVDVLGTQYSSAKVSLVLAFKSGKNWKQMVDILFKNLRVKLAVATQYFASTDMGKGSAVDPKEIASYIQDVYGQPVTVRDNSQEAVFETVSKKSVGDLVLVTGSLYLVGEARTLWQLPSF